MIYLFIIFIWNQLRSNYDFLNKVNIFAKWLEKIRAQFKLDSIVFSQHSVSMGRRLLIEYLIGSVAAIRIALQRCVSNTALASKISCNKLFKVYKQRARFLMQIYLSRLHWDYSFKEGNILFLYEKNVNI